jgi:hypothetical protein
MATASNMTIFHRDTEDLDNAADEAENLTLAWYCAVGIWYQKSPHDAKNPSVWSKLLDAFLFDR